MKRTLLSWSSGKDSAWSLYLLQQQKEYGVIGLLTTFNPVADRHLGEGEVENEAAHHFPATLRTG